MTNDSARRERHRSPERRERCHEASAQRNAAYVRLIGAAREDDRSARVELATRVQDEAYAAGLRALKNPHDAADVAQECVLRVLQYLPNIDLERAPAAYVSRIVRCVIANRKSPRSRPRRERTNSVDVEPKDGTMGIGGLETPREDDPAWRVSLDEDFQRLHGALTCLSPRQREAVQMRYFEGLSCQEIARQMSTTITAVHQLLFKARARLADWLGKPGWDHV
jgi:RNA polymerase sigma-70 factor (ECF subfamily)